MFQHFYKILFSYDKIENKTSFAKLTSAKCLFLYKVTSFLNDCSAFGSSYSCVSFSERIERKFKTQNLNPREF